MLLKLTATEWVTVANLFDSAPAPADARTRRLQDRLYDMLCDWRTALRDGDPAVEVEHELPPSYVQYMRGYLSDRTARQYHQIGWVQIIRPLLVNKLGWEAPAVDDQE